jgi:hypothetical protein
MPPAKAAVRESHQTKGKRTVLAEESTLKAESAVKGF